MKTILTWRLLLAAGLASLAGVAGLVYAATAFTPDSQPVGTLAQLEVSNYVLTSGHEVVFKTDYERNTWSGNVRAFPVDARGIVDQNADWWNDGANSQLDLQNYDTGRIIVTLKDDGSKQPFRWANLSGAQQGTLGTATTGPKVLNFVRGDRSNELANGGTFRDRTSVMGDILHSRPYYLTDPTGPVLFVGGNDGMLHVLDAQTTGGGDELWAFVPRTLIPKLSALTTNPYVHTHYVDGQINIGTVTISGSDKDVLVGGMGAGGRGLYAIDVTNPRPASEAAAAANILWEVNSSTGSYGNLGYTYGTPVIAKVNASSKSAVIVGNGYNSGGVSSLFVIDATNGSLIKEVTTSGAAGGGLSTPACIDTNADGLVDYCYAGDIDGKLWKFDISSSGSGSWSASLLFTTSPAQAITSVPAIGAHPYGGYMVNFATGRLFTSADLTDTSVFYAYGIWDGAPAGNTALLAQTLTERSYVQGTQTRRVRSVTGNTPDWTPTPSPCVSCAIHHRGWRVPLPIAGERVTGDTLFIENNRFYFTSVNPTITNTSPVPNGEIWLTELDFVSGSTANVPIFDLSEDLLLTSLDRIKYISGDSIPAGSSIGDPNLTATGVPVGKFVDNGVGSQPLLVQLATLNTTLINQNPDITLPAASTADRGVPGGHFDFDIYYPSYNGASKKHIHEYDDKFDVTGVNMLNASDTSFNLVNAIKSTSTKFKILVQNQYLNPGATLSVGGAAHTSVKLYNGQAKQTDATTLLANAPTYTRASAGFTLEFNLPLDAFTPKDWWTAAGGTGYVAGDVRVGLQPTQTSCVNKAASSSDTMYYSVVPPTNGVDGPGTASTTLGARHNGALVIQIIKDTTTASQIEMNVANRPEYGWRVKSGNYSGQVLAEYTTFWHHPNAKCYGDAGWTKVPPKDLSAPGLAGTPASGADDPKYGSFRATSDVVSSVTTVNDNVSVTVTTYADGTRQTITKTKNSDGTITVVTVNPDGSTTTATMADTEGGVVSGGDERGTQARTGRISWTERPRN